MARVRSSTGDLSIAGDSPGRNNHTETMIRNSTRWFPLGALGLVVCSAEAVAQICTTSAVSASQGVLGNAMSNRGMISRDGGWVLITTAATNLVGSPNSFQDVVLYECATGTLTWASRPVSAASPDLHVYSNSISADGRWSVMESNATNLVPGDTNGRADVFVFDRVSGTLTLESRSAAGTLGDLNSYSGRVSDDGSELVFASEATNLVAGDTNGVTDIFVKDRVSGAVSVLSVGMGGAQSNGTSASPIFSADSRYVAFASQATNLVPGDTANVFNVFVHDRVLGTTIVVDRDLSGAIPTYPVSDHAFSADGRFVAFVTGSPLIVVGDTNGVEDLFVRDLVTGVITRENVTPNGAQVGHPGVNPSLSADGRFLLFQSDSPLLVPGDANNRADAILRDRLSGANELFSVDGSGGQGNDTSTTDAFALSGDGQSGVFQSMSTNFAPPDTNASEDVFLRACDAGVSTYCVAKLNSLGCLPVVGHTGLSSAGATSGFEIHAAQVRNGKSGLLLYSIVGPNNVPFQGGTLCIATPLRRSTGVNSGGALPPAQDCSGFYSLDMNSFASGVLGGTPAPELSVVGTPVWCQWWGRDPGFVFPLNTTLSDGLAYTVLP